MMITDKYLEVIRKTSAGFRGTFVFDPAHTVDNGLGQTADFVEVGDRLVYVPEDCDVRDEDCCEISDQLDEHVARAIADLLNAVPTLIGEIDRLRSLVPHRPRALVRVVSPRRDHRYEGVVVCHEHLRGFSLDDAPLEDARERLQERWLIYKAVAVSVREGAWRETFPARVPLTLDEYRQICARCCACESPLEATEHPRCKRCPSCRIEVWVD